jgi:hypothetical protein
MLSLQAKILIDVALRGRCLNDLLYSYRFPTEEVLVLYTRVTPGTLATAIVQALLCDDVVYDE